MSSPDPAKTTVAVAPTSTVVVSLDVRDFETATIQLDNLDATQTLTGQIERRINPASAWSVSTMGDFSSVGPTGSATGSVTADIDVSGTGYLRLTGLMSGAGGNVSVCVRLGRSK
jgi:hypothetical protein